MYQWLFYDQFYYLFLFTPYLNTKHSHWASVSANKLLLFQIFLFLFFVPINHLIYCNIFNKIFLLKKKYIYCILCKKKYWKYNSIFSCLEALYNLIAFLYVFFVTYLNLVLPHFSRYLLLNPWFFIFLLLTISIISFALVSVVHSLHISVQISNLLSCIIFHARLYGLGVFLILFVLI